MGVWAYYFKLFLSKDTIHGRNQFCCWLGGYIFESGVLKSNNFYFIELSMYTNRLR